MRTLKSKKEMHKRKKMLGIRISYLICVPRVESHLIAGSVVLFVDEQRACIPLEVVAHLPCYLITLVGLMLLTLRSGPHS
jgi:hypothetical protein